MVPVTSETVGGKESLRQNRAGIYFDVTSPSACEVGFSECGFFPFDIGRTAAFWGTKAYLIPSGRRVPGQSSEAN
jgi:hypothetical protein